MERWTQELFDYLMTSWQDATLHDYGHIVLGVIVTGWFLGRYFPR
jgi:hypothetical protein